MKFRKSLCALVIALFSLQTLQFTARADEGMWPFNNVPRAEIKKKYGFEITDAWLRKVQLASVRFNSGGSGSFVSADGLVMTNHHIASDVLQKISTPEKDYIKDGFYAPTRDKEVKAPDLELNQVVGERRERRRSRVRFRQSRPHESPRYSCPPRISARLWHSLPVEVSPASTRSAHALQLAGRRAGAARARRSFQH